MAVRVVTDSTAALDRRTAEAEGVVVVPMRVVLGGVTYRDGDLPYSVLFDRFGEGVSTAGPAPAGFAAAVAGAPDGALVLTLASRLSSTHDAAVAAAGAAAVEVRVLDTGTAAGAQGLVVLHAARLARAGAGLEEIEAEARRVAGRVQLVAAFETLDYLVRGGRVAPAVAGVAERLRLQPMIELRPGGEIRRLRPALSRRAALNRIVGRWRSTRIGGARLHVIALHVEARGEADALLRRVRAEVEPATALVAEFGAVMAVHTGPGLVGLSWWWETSD